MLLKLSYFCIFLLLPLILLLVNMMVSLKANLTRNTLSSFECGFDSFLNARTPFSLHFFLLSIIFLVFDLEIALLFPFPTNLLLGGEKMLLMFTSFMIILFLGVFHEWNEGSLEWF